MFATKKIVVGSVILGMFVVASALGLTYSSSSQTRSASESEVGFEVEPLEDDESKVYPRLRGLEDWTRPDGPFRVGLQVGHWKAAEAPDELENLRLNTGTRGGGKAEWEVNLAIAEATKLLLEPKGIVVDILPVTIPENYYADLFLAIHADGNTNSNVHGFKVASPRRDYTGKAETFAQLLADKYEQATELDRDPNVSHAMRGYYAFNWRRYDHSIHPMTVATIIEIGFLTNAGDRRIIVNQPERSAAGIAKAILQFLGVTA